MEDGIRPAFRFFLVDDDDIVIRVQRALLESAGHTVSHTTESEKAQSLILAQKPDCVLVDLMMPGMDGLELLRHLRAEASLASTRIVVVSAKAYEYDRKQAMKMGADGFITKPVRRDTFLDQLEAIIGDRVEVGFWGVRGTLPVPGTGSLRYGGNTSCITLDFPRGQFFIFDAGTGIKALSNHLLAQGRTRLDAKIFISHPHWDHINALPFFVPLFIQGNEFEILGATHGDVGMRQLISAQMDDIYFPITIKEFAGRVYFRDLREETLEVDGIAVRTMLLSHPGNCLGYRVEYEDRSFCYVTDNELFLPDSPLYNAHYVEQLTAFVGGAEVLITDCTHTDEEYLSKVQWGHSSIGQVVDLAHNAGVKTLYLFHHDPDQDDDAIDAKLEAARAGLDALGSATNCVAPAETQTIKF